MFNLTFTYQCSQHNFAMQLLQGTACVPFLMHLSLLEAKYVFLQFTTDISFFSCIFVLANLNDPPVKIADRKSVV